MNLLLKLYTFFHFQLQNKWTGYFESAIWNKVEDPPDRTDCLFSYVKVDDKQLESMNDNQLFRI